MTSLDHQEFAEHHLIYYARAQALGLDHRIHFDHVDIERVEELGLIAFYLLLNGVYYRVRPLPR